jgi:hypothetical protein
MQIGVIVWVSRRNSMDRYSQRHINKAPFTTVCVGMGMKTAVNGEEGQEDFKDCATGRAGGGGIQVFLTLFVRAHDINGKRKRDPQGL